MSVMASAIDLAGRRARRSGLRDGLLALAFLSGCDNTQSSQEEPELHLLWATPRADQGLDCPSAACSPPAADAPIVLQFDRWLAPNSPVRQSLDLRAGTASGPLLSPRYDLLRRQVAYFPSEPLDVGLTYVVTPLSNNLKVLGGFQSYDGGQLQLTEGQKSWVFRPGPSVGIHAEVPQVSCRQVLNELRAAGCASGACHNRGDRRCGSGGAWDAPQSSCVTVPRAGLVLSDSAGLLAAIGRVARSSDRGPTSGKPMTSPARFGIGMPLIEPGRPELSFLLYRVLLSPELYNDAKRRHGVRPLDATELARASQWLGVGPMPPSDVGWPRGSAPSSLVVALQSWVWGGAQTSDCE